MNGWLSECNRLKGERDEERTEDEGEADQVAVSSALLPLPGSDHSSTLVVIDGFPQSCGPRRAETPRKRQTGNPL